MKEYICGGVFVYEYRCLNESCNQVWTIKEGNIGTLYLTCPYCNKGRGAFIRQIKDDFLHEDIQELKAKKASEEQIEYVEPVKEKTAEVKKKTQKSKQTQDKPDKKDTPAKKDKPEVKKESKEKPKRQKPEIKVKVNVPESELENEEDNIFEIIKKKRQQEEEFKKDLTEDLDILEISGDTIEEIEKRIKEFEEYYYIKVVGKNIQQQGKRYNCIIKYHRT